MINCAWVTHRDQDPPDSRALPLTRHSRAEGALSRGTGQCTDRSQAISWLSQGIRIEGRTLCWLSLLPACPGSLEISMLPSSVADDKPARTDTTTTADHHHSFLLMLSRDKKLAMDVAHPWSDAGLKLLDRLQNLCP